MTTPEVPEGQLNVTSVGVGVQVALSKHETSVSADSVMEAGAVIRGVPTTVRDAGTP